MRLVKHFAATVHLRIEFVLFVHQTHEIVVTLAGIDIVLLIPVEFAQTLTEHGFGKAILSALLYALLPGINGVNGVLTGYADVTLGIVDLVEIVFVARVFGHTVQTLQHSLALPLCHHFGLHNLSIEGQFVRRIETGAFGECLVSLLVVTSLTVQLCEQEPHSRLQLTAFGVRGDFLHIRDSLGIALIVDEESGLTCVQLLLSA